MSSKRQFKTEGRLLSHIKNILEGYDNLTVMSTVDAKMGLFDVIYPESREEEVLIVMKGIKEEVNIEDL